MKNPRRKTSLMAQHVQQHEAMASELGAPLAPSEKVELMAEFQRAHTCGPPTGLREIAVRRVGVSLRRWFACDVCGNVVEGARA